MTKDKYKIQLVQLNNKYGSQVYLPYSVGILQAYVQQDEEISSNFSFSDFVFIRQKVSEMAKNIGSVDIFGISCYVWNWALSLRLAEEVRKNNPNCLIIFGGPQVPNGVKESFFEKYNFIDIAVHGEGEVTFLEILKSYAKHAPDQKFNDIAGCTFYDRSVNAMKKGRPRPRIIDLDSIPSPYLEGTFDYLFDKKDYTWMITWETNRGCPFKCSFCDWGSAIATKVRKFSDKRLIEEIDFFSAKEVDLVFGADANFGIFKRDTEFALRLAQNKMETGYPNQFRVCFTKNTTDRVFELAQIFAKAGMAKGVSISMQSLNNDTLEKIQRKNIKMKFFKDLQKKYVANDLVTYTELILPLPGETYESFVEGIDSLLDSSQHSGIVIYNCSIMPNAEMGGDSYQQEHGLDMVEIPIFQAHSDMKDTDEVVEKETIIVGTNTMTREQYRKTYKFAWAIQCMHLLGLLQVVSIVLRYHYGIKYSDFYQGLISYGEQNRTTNIGLELQRIDKLLDGVFAGHGFDQYVSGFEEVSWPPEEASYLRISEQLDSFYEEVYNFITTKYSIDDDILKDIIKYQKLRLVNFNNQEEKVFHLKYNVHYYYEECRAGMLSHFEKIPTSFKLSPYKFFKDRKSFSREIVWYGRKGGKFFHPITEVAK